MNSITAAIKTIIIISIIYSFEDEEMIPKIIPDRNETIQIVIIAFVSISYLPLDFFIHAIYYIILAVICQIISYSKMSHVQQYSKERIYMPEPEDIRKMRDCHKDSPIVELIKENELRINFNFQSLFWSKERGMWLVVRDEYYWNEDERDIIKYEGTDESAAVKALKGEK
jgi:hypothetical protein